MQHRQPAVGKAVGLAAVLGKAVAKAVGQPAGGAFCFVLVLVSSGGLVVLL